MTELGDSATFTQWADALDRLEFEIEFAGKLSPELDEPWAPPQGLGPLPLELRDRAAAILIAQRAATARLDEHRRETGRHLSALRTVPQVNTHERSAYLDVSG